MPKESESRFSQDQDWDVHEPEGARLSETELAEIRRLQDSTSRAERPSPSAPVLTPVLPLPKEIKKPKDNIPAVPSNIIYEECGPFIEKFPDIFREENLKKLILQRWNHFDHTLFSPDEVVRMILIREMQRLADLHQIPEESPCRSSLNQLVIRFLKSHFALMRLLVETLRVSARELNLPKKTETEKAEATALEFLFEILERSDFAPTLIPPSSKIKKSLSEAILKAVSTLVRPQIAAPLAQKMIFSLECERALVEYLSRFDATPHAPPDSKEDSFFKKSSPAEKAAMAAALIIPIQNTSAFLFFLNVIAREIDEKDSGDEIAEGFLYGLDKALCDAVSESDLEEVAKSLWFAGKIVQKISLFQAFSPNESAQTVFHDFVERLKTPQTTFAEKASPELERQLKLIKPSREQAAGFVRRVLRQPRMNQAEIELSA